MCLREGPPARPARGVCNEGGLTCWGTTEMRYVFEYFQECMYETGKYIQELAQAMAA